MKNVMSLQRTILDDAIFSKTLSAAVVFPFFPHCIIKFDCVTLYIDNVTSMQSMYKLKYSDITAHSSTPHWPVIKYTRIMSN